MAELSIRWTNFRAFADTGELTIRPLTVILGANASGKTSLIAPILLLKQTLEAKDPTNALKTKGGMFNAGFYKDFILLHKKELPLFLQIRFGKWLEANQKPKSPIGKNPPALLKLCYHYSSPSESPILQEFTVEDGHGRTMLTRNRLQDGAYTIEAVPNLPEQSEVTEAIKNSKPKGFLFTPDSVFAELFDI